MAMVQVGITSAGYPLEHDLSGMQVGGSAEQTSRLAGEPLTGVPDMSGVPVKPNHVHVGLSVSDTSTCSSVGETNDPIERKGALHPSSGYQPSSLPSGGSSSELPPDARKSF